MRILSIFVFVHFFVVFCIYLLLGAFLKAGINKFEISIKFCVFLIPILIFFKKKFFWVIIALFAILKCICEKNGTFSNILQKVKSCFFANIYHSPCDSYWNSKKSIKLKPPSVYPPAFVGGGGRTHSPGGEGGGGSIFWKTRDIGLPSYSNNLSTTPSYKICQKENLSY
jgi:hypothetical protein